MSLYSYGKDAAAANQAKIGQAECPTTTYIKLDSILIKKSSVQALSRSPALEAQIHPNPSTDMRLGKATVLATAHLALKSFETEYWARARLAFMCK